MANAQDIYDAAVGLYRSAEQLIREIGQSVPDYNFVREMASFDLILQAILFRAAIADGRVTENERLFLEGITKYADFLQVISQVGDTPITWENLAGLDEEEKETAATLTEDLVDKITTDFIMPLAIVDAIDKERDYLDELDTILLSIFMCFTIIDGEGRQSEMEAAVKTYVRLFARKWQFFVAAAESADTNN